MILSVLPQPPCELQLDNEIWVLKPFQVLLGMVPYFVGNSITNSIPPSVDDKTFPMLNDDRSKSNHKNVSEMFHKELLDAMEWSLCSNEVVIEAIKCKFSEIKIGALK